MLYQVASSDVQIKMKDVVMNKPPSGPSGGGGGGGGKPPTPVDQAKENVKQKVHDTLFPKK
jgi:hypothetical protein